jgi:HSP20 family molecular chaperone IbpA
MSGRLSAFNSPFLLGFDQIEQTLDRLTKSASDGYPPYNIEQHADGNLRIIIAVAGFTIDDLSIQVEDAQLMIRGRQAPNDDAGERIFLHRGIAARQFQRAFLLADGIDVVGANLRHGLLHIDLRLPPPATTVRTIEINAGEPNSNSNQPVTIDSDGQIDKMQKA